ncbi:heparan-alpha-glucosaminide N-acetyltransferase domain-containing protein [Myceligenerans salitolerans]|uniref:DUF1624 domain-containing protein n=1 Tax=Myceligenerans salitolerans TaxID=1230528 RepID=A0ABS3IG47_9MICO|nr:heparan-alpha-glucosaminide N-acetyltransferase domain-containing protein [Myceligenerans salitolerans]MBO0611042.1 DUF1624 domain-containing protein [Myceligenerans salitolerans]
MSLDALRGTMLVASVVSNSMVHVPEWYDHARWAGVRGMDLIFPVFVTITGMGLGFALHRRVAPGALARRAAVLFAVGLLYNAVTQWMFDPASWRIPGVLQLYAAVVVVLGLLHLLTRSWMGWAAVTLILATAHTVVLAATAVTCPGGLLTPACNPSGAIDQALFGTAHMYRQGLWGHDPEGAVAVLGALVSASAGATAAHLLLAVRARADGTRQSVAASVVPLLCVAAAWAVTAWLAIQVPAWATGTPTLVMKRLWTAPFALMVAAGTIIVLLGWYLLLDRMNTGRLLQGSTYPLLALGRNSLLVYFGSHILMSLLVREFGGAPSLIDRIWPVLGREPQATLSLLLVAGWTALAVVLHRKRVYLRP